MLGITLLLQTGPHWAFEPCPDVILTKMARHPVYKFLSLTNIFAKKAEISCNV